MKSAHITFLLLSTLTGITGSLHADQRLFVWSYQYQTMEKGQAEVEQYTSLKPAGSVWHDTTVVTELQTELEVGMTDHFDMGFYQVFRQDPAAGFAYRGFKLRARIRFGETGQYPLDPLLYLEYKGKPGFSEHELEGKLILAKTFNRLTLAINPMIEMEYGDGESESVLGFAGGISYQIGKTLHLGLETKGDSEVLYAGPTLAHGTEHLWMAFGYLTALGDADPAQPARQIRCIVGVGL